MMVVVFMPQCSAVDMLYHLFDHLMYMEARLYIAVLVLFFFVLLHANKRFHNGGR